MKIEILKPFKFLVVGQRLDIDSEYCAGLIKKGIAKSLEEVAPVEKPEETKENVVKTKKVK